MKNTIGLLGLGDLGSRLAVQASKNGFKVLAFDLKPNKKIAKEPFGIDRSLIYNILTLNLVYLDSTTF